MVMVRSMMSQTTLPKSFWDYALETAARILNMVPTKKVDKTPYEIWHGQAPKLSYLKVWGCEALVKRVTLTKTDILDPRSFRCIFVGYPKETMGYSFYNPSKNKVLYTNPSVDTSLDHEEDDQEIDGTSEVISISHSQVSCYTDAGYLTDADNLKSQTGYVFVLNGGDVDWKSTKQSIFATSSTDAEYIAAFDASKEA
ncbi:retrotransposon protein, putative, ty1-copia subclass [Tanacetum coccineum]